MGRWAPGAKWVLAFLLLWNGQERASAFPSLLAARLPTRGAPHGVSGRGQRHQNPRAVAPLLSSSDGGEGERAGPMTGGFSSPDWPPAVSRGGVSASALAENDALHQEDMERSTWMWPGGLAGNGRGASRTLGWRRFGFAHEEDVPLHFGKGDMCRISTVPIIAVGQCKNLIHEAETDFIGWHRETTVRYGVPVDRQCSKFPVDELNWSYTFVNQELLPKLVPEIKAAFPDVLGSSQLRLQVCRILKYDAAQGFVELGYHRDGPLVTAVIGLNDPSAYEGGGTMIEALDYPGAEEDPDGDGIDGVGAELQQLSPRGTSVRLKAGHVLLHPGGVLHGGAPITKGVRYAMALFFSDASRVEHVKYCELRVEKSLLAAASATDASEKKRLIELAAAQYAESLALGAPADPAVVSFLSQNGMPPM